MEEIDGWLVERAEPFKWGAEWIVRAHKPSETPLYRRTIAVAFPAEGLSREDAEAKALPMLREKIASCDTHPKGGDAKQGSVSDG